MCEMLNKYWVNTYYRQRKKQAPEFMDLRLSIPSVLPALVQQGAPYALPFSLVTVLRVCGKEKIIRCVRQMLEHSVICQRPCV
jgi:hypothetical protein